MALGGITATWDENDPADADVVGTGAADIRSTKTNLRGALDSEHHFASAGGAGMGAHRKGSAVAFYGAASAVSSSDTEGRLMLTSDTTRLYHVASAITHFVGGRFAVEAAPATNILNSRLTSAVTQIWALECGGFQVPANSNGTTVTLQNTYVSAVAMVTLISGVSCSVPALPTAAATGATLTMSLYQNAAEQITSTYTYTGSYMVMGFKAG